MPPVPEEFLCPISLDIMTDPVIMRTPLLTAWQSMAKHTACNELGILLEVCGYHAEAAQL